MDFIELLQNVLPIINALNQNNSSQSEKPEVAASTFETKSTPPSFSSPFFALPNYQFDPKNVKNQDLNYSQNTSSQPQHPSQQGSLFNLVNILKEIDFNTIIPLLSNIFGNKQTTTKPQQKKDNDVSFSNNYTKVETFNYNEL